MASIVYGDTTTASSTWQVRFAWIALAWGLIIGPILISLMQPPQHESPASNDLASLSSASASAMQNAVISAVQLAILVVGAGAIVLSVRYARPLGAGVGIWIGAMALAFGPVVASLLSTGLFVPPDVIRIPLFFTAAYLLPPVSLEWFVRRCKSAIELYTVLTLVAAVVVPARALQVGYDAGLVDAVSVRLHGIANHANIFAPMLLVYFILGWMAPARTARERAMLFVVGGALLLTQSKTVIVAALLMYAIRFFYVQGFARYMIVYAGAVFSAASLLALTFVRPTWDRGLIDYFIADNDFTALTGRTTVWEYALDLWRDNRWFGYGVDYWYIQMTENFAALYHWVPHHAHNQVIQTLGISGLVGLAGLLTFLVILMVKAVKLRRVTHGASLALLLFLMIRGLTEVPIVGSLDENLFVLFITFTVLLLADRLPEDARYAGSGQEPQPSPVANSAGTGDTPPWYTPTAPRYGRAAFASGPRAGSGVYSTLEATEQHPGRPSELSFDRIDAVNWRGTG